MTNVQEMPSWRILADDGEREPRRNLALDEALGRSAGPEPTVRTWRNGPCVVVGRSQLVEAEVDQAACDAMGVPVLRRFTGGGTVYHDEGNLNVTVVLRRDDPRLARRPGLARLPGLYRLVLEPIASAVSSLGLPAVMTDRDVLVDGGKVTGVAAWLGARALLVHGTLLVDSDLAALARVLAGPGAPGDPRWERTRSRRSPVTSLARAFAGRSPGAIGAVAEVAVVRSITGGEGRRDRPTDEEAATARWLMSSRYGRPAWHRNGA